MLPVRVLPFCVQVRANVPATWSGVTSCHVPFHVPARPAGADGAGEAEGTGEEIAVGAAVGWTGGSDAAVTRDGNGLAGGVVGDGEAVAVQAPTTRISPAAKMTARTSARSIGDASFFVGWAPFALRVSLAVLRRV
jgi:hypothetical protein